ncbi:MAG: diacylglycerol kinase family protein [Turicibacter sp.]|nr:diacylglycerol kinase family protein [Turicibacter sp.]
MSWESNVKKVKEDHSLSALARSFKYAFIGILTAMRISRNIKVHYLISIVVVLMAIHFRITPLEYAVLLLVITQVICLEMVNTAIERTIDLLTGKQHVYAKIAKDVAAGAVLMSVGAAVTIGTIIFWPHLANLFY